MMPAPRQGGAPTRFRCVLVAMLAVVIFVNFVDRSAIAFAVPDLRRDLGLSGADVGWVPGVSGWATDRALRRTRLPPVQVVNNRFGGVG